MQYEKEKCISRYDNLTLERAYMIPDGERRGIVYISHGMSEHKERYESFMHYLVENGYIAAIHDHRGHGGSVVTAEDLGYFYTEDEDAIVEDLHQMILEAKKRFPKLPLFLFSHSMGTLVSRNYIKKYDNEIQGLILCGPPTKNIAVPFAIQLTKILKNLWGDKYRNYLLNTLVFGVYNRKEKYKNGWLSSDYKEVQRYQKDDLSGFIFTTNGFLNLFQLLQTAYERKGWKVGNPRLPIYIIAGEKDPVIQSRKQFRQLQIFLRERGYRNVTCKLYKSMKHELLHEKNRKKVYQDIIKFISK